MKWIPNNWTRVRLINKRNGDATSTTLTELIESKGYGELAEILSGSHPLFIISCKRKGDNRVV